MPQTKTKKQLKALKKLEAEYKAELATGEFPSYRATMLYFQIQDLNLDWEGWEKV